MPGNPAPFAAGGAAARFRQDVAVIIPTKDRPQFLEEAIASALRQSLAPAEVIVVDDGSLVPVDNVALRSRHGPTVRTLRNAQSMGLAYSRNRGVEECTSEYVIHLDDDDLLTPDAIADCLAAMRAHPEVELVMFSVAGFGPNAAYFNRVHPAGAARVIELSQGSVVANGIVLFDKGLFPALLQTVPAAFQRVMTKVATWHKVSDLRRRVYRLDPDIPDDNTAKLRLTGPLRDSEWARYAAIVCNRTCLIQKPLYMARCAGQGYSSQPANRQAHSDQALLMLKRMASGAEALPELATWKGQIGQSLANAYFDTAYQWHQAGDRRQAWRNLRGAMTNGIEGRHLRLALRLIAPISKERR